MGLHRSLFAFAVLGTLTAACSSDDPQDADSSAQPDAGAKDDAANESDASADEADEDDSKPEPTNDAEAPQPADTEDAGGSAAGDSDGDDPDGDDPDGDDPSGDDPDGGDPNEEDNSTEPELDGGVPDEPTSGPNDASVPSEVDADVPSFEDGGAELQIPLGSVPPELVGVWQQTRASASDYEFDDGFGGTFSLTSGFSVQLKISPEGQYYFAYFSSGTSPNCASVSQFDRSVGSAVLEGNTLTLTPVQRVIESTNCDDSRSVEGGTEPIVLSVALTEDRQYYGGMRMYSLALEGYVHPLALSSLFRVPDYEAFQPAQPEDFVLGEVGPYQELQGLWAATPDSDVDFYNPQTGAYYLPELNGSPHRWLRFDGDNYEAAVALQNVNTEGVCKSDLIYYERGTALFQVTDDVGGLGNHFNGHTRFDATDSRLMVNIRECGEDDGVFALELQPLSSYYRFNMYTESPVMFELNCAFEYSEWQSLLCETNGFAGFYPR